ncbi:MAG: FAD-dependent oxidoreductase [Cyanobium sp.]
MAEPASVTLDPTRTPSRVIVVGGGLVGLCCAWRLLLRGHDVQLIDPGHPLPNGSQAALGVLMARVCHRSSGRGWRLRQQSLELWNLWRQELASRDLPIAWRQGLLLLAADAADQERHQRLLADRRRQSLGLELWDQSRLERLSPALPFGALSGLYSHDDGQIDPLGALEAIGKDAGRLGIRCLKGSAATLENGGRGWRVNLQGGGHCQADWVVLCAGLGLRQPLASLGRELAMEPVLGQALELERTDAPPARAGGGRWTWPGVIHWQGINLIPRPDQAGGDRLWLGATLEPGLRGDDDSVQTLRSLNGAAPAWLEQARERRRWQGLRTRPLGRPAPVLEPIAAGVLLASGHYRNGVLLAPATATWVVEQIEAGGTEP